MNRCPRCNAELPANARFCNKCGFNAPAVPQGGPGAGSMQQSPVGAVQAGPNQKLPPLVQAKPANAPEGSRPPAGPAMNSAAPQPGLPPLQAQQRGPAPVAGNSGTPPVSLPGIQPVRTSTPPMQNPNSGRPNMPSSGSPAQAPKLPPLAGNGAAPSAVIQPLPETPRQQSPMQPRPAMPMGNAAPPRIANGNGLPPGAGMIMAPGQIPPGMYPNPGGAAPESLAATSQAAEHWRKSWLDRQRAEAGPAIGIARGQSPVAEPLMKMQTSFLRMRALAGPNNGSSQGMSFSFWVAIGMIVCLIIGLGSYVIYTYLPGAPLQTQLNTASSAPDPTLTFVSTAKNPPAIPTIKAGQTFEVQGSYFGANQTITFILNNTQLATKAQSSAQGSFTTTLSIPANTLAGAYALQAQNNSTGKHAFLNIQVLPTTQTSTTNVLTLSVANLKFTGAVAGGNPPAQPITLTNQNAATLNWTATAITNNGINWLVVENNQVEGTLGANGTTAMSIGVSTAGLISGTYTGIVAFTVTGQGQVILPVTLQMGVKNIELSVAPNPVVAVYQPGGTCGTATMTLIDLSNSPINWNVQDDRTVDMQHIAINGKTGAMGVITPDATTGPTAVLNLTCTGVNLNDTYQVTVYYDNMVQHVSIFIGN